MQNLISMPQALQKLREFVATHPSQNAAAAELNISPAFLSDVLNGARPLSDRIARQLGYERVVMFKEVEK